MKDTSYYIEISIPFKNKSDFTREVASVVANVVGTREEIDAKEKELLIEANNAFIAHSTKRQKEINEKRLEFKMDLAKENGVEDNPKLDLLWEKAWDLGHSCGLNEVSNYFMNLVDLIT